MSHSTHLAGGPLGLGSLAPEVSDVLERVRAEAADSGADLWWVGGGVRDLLLDRPTNAVDLDFVLEIDPEPIARRIARRLEGELTLHPQFLTATIETGTGGRVDLGRARREAYPRPGSLPEVAPAGLETDLRRRDFSVNAIAIRLTPAPLEILDPCAGRADLDGARLRVLHPASFLDDPTRILRGIRFATRLDFDLDPETRRLASAALSARALDTLSGDRLRRELELTFESHPTAVEALARLHRIGVLRAIGMAALDPRTEARLRAAGAAASGIDWAGSDLVSPGPWQVVRFGLLSTADPELRSAALERLTSRPEAPELRRQIEAAVRAERTLASHDVPPHTLFRSLSPLDPPALAWVASAAAESPQRIEEHIRVQRRLELEVSGGDLVAAGIPPGPAVGEALRETRDARLDGRISSDRELEFALQVARGGQRG